MGETGRRLPPGLAGRLGARFGHDFGRVRVHDGPRADRSARDLDARAYTVGEHVVFAGGQYAPETPGGLRLLTHELAHVVQQSGAEQTAVQRFADGSATTGPDAVGTVGAVTGSRQSATDAGFERDADRATRALFRGDRVTVGRRSADPVVARKPWGSCPPGKRLSGGLWTRYHAAELAGIGLYRSVRPGHQLLTNQDLSGVGLREMPTGGDQRLIHAIYDLFRSPGTPSPIQRPKSVDPRAADRVPGEGSPQEIIEGRDVEKEPRRQVPREPDIIDLDPTTREVYDVTTRKNASAKAKKIERQYVAPLNSILNERGIGGPQFKAGTSMPKPANYVVGRPRGGGAGTQNVVICFGPTDFDANPGVLAYEVIQRKRRRRRRKPHPNPVWVPVTLAAWYLSKQLEQAGKKLAQKLGKRALGPAVQVATVLAAVVLLTGEAQAEVSFGGEGKDPLVALFEYLESNGTPVPPELRKRIEANPELQQRLRKAASAGNLSDVQKELMRQTTQVINDNLDQFSDEDLRRLAEAAEIASGGQTGGQAPTVAELKRGIQQARQTKRQRAGTTGKGRGTGEGGTESGEGGTEKPPETETPATPETEKLPKGDTGGTSGESPGGPGRERAETKQIRKLLDDAPDHVERLLKQMLGGPEAKGPKLTAEFVRKFVATTGGLTPEQVTRLEGSLREIRGESLAEILAELEKAVARVKRSTATERGTAEGDTAERTEKPAKPAAPAGGRQQPETRQTQDPDVDRYPRQMREQIRGYGAGWKSVPAGAVQLVWTEQSDERAKIRAKVERGGSHDATAVAYFQFEGVKYAAGVTVRITGMTDSGTVCEIRGWREFVPADPGRRSIPWERVLNLGIGDRVTLSSTETR
nr:DUF4157 domain-containing protein [Salinirubrum litoreum]